MQVIANAIAGEANRPAQIDGKIGEEPIHVIPFQDGVSVGQTFEHRGVKGRHPRFFVHPRKGDVEVHAVQIGDQGQFGVDFIFCVYWICNGDI